MEEPPYVAGPVVNDSNYFVGRSEIIREILAEIRIRSVVLIHGQRRVGKSSVLARIDANLKEDGSKYLPVFIDLQGKLGTPINKMTAFLSKAIQKKCRLTLAPLAATEDSIAKFKTKWLPQAISEIQGREFEGIVLLLDEFDDVSLKIRTPAREFYELMNQIVRTTIVGLRVVVVLGRDPSELLEPAERMMLGAKKYQISLMSQKEINSLIDLSKETLKWSDAAREELWSLAKGHPLISQSICSKIWYKKFLEIRNGRIANVDKDDIDQAFSFDEYGHVIQNSWDILLPEEQVVVCFISADMGWQREEDILNFIEEMELTDSYSKRSMHHYLNKLRNDDWISNEGIYYAIKVPVYRQWVKEHHALRDLVNKLFKSNVRAVSLALQAQNARDLPDAIDLLERSVKLNPDESKTRDDLIKNIEEMIGICLREGNSKIALDYLDRLERVDQKLAWHYKIKIEAQRQTNIISQRIESLLRADEFLRAYKQAINLGNYDPQGMRRFFLEILIGQTIFVLQRWFLTLLFWSPFPLVAMTVSQSSFPVENFTWYPHQVLITAITLILSLFSAILESFEEEWLRLFVSAVFFIVGTSYCILSLFLVPNISTPVRVFTCSLVFFSVLIYFWPGTDKITKMTGAFLNLFVLLLICFWTTIIPPEYFQPFANKPVQSVEVVPTPPDVPGLIWEQLESLIEYSQSKK